jgi:hypothetical protein
MPGGRARMSSGIPGRLPFSAVRYARRARADVQAARLKASAGDCRAPSQPPGFLERVTCMANDTLSGAASDTDEQMLPPRPWDGIAQPIDTAPVVAGVESPL